MNVTHSTSSTCRTKIQKSDFNWAYVWWMTVYLLVNHYVDASGRPLRLLRVQMARPGGNSTHDILTACRICQRFLLVSHLPHCQFHGSNWHPCGGMHNHIPLKRELLAQNTPFKKRTQPWCKVTCYSIIQWI